MRTLILLQSFAHALRSTSTPNKSLGNIVKLSSIQWDDNISARIPSLVVFDLDMCLWKPEMFELNEIPTEKVFGDLGPYGRGVVGVKSGIETIELFPDGLQVLQEFYLGKYPNMKIATASACSNPHAVRIGRKAMEMLEVLPGVTMRQVFAKGWEEGFEGNLQIGRTPPLTPNKAKSHFPFLLEATKIPYSEMIFFDDCNWGDHCGNVEKACPGVVTQRTPRGLQRRDWEIAFAKYAEKFDKN
mmetsp:Transcript_21084/g.21205  ORF Transcript_21084/g.21205 Transcript_21084/m.21205 type:complete len:243 (+) Transcript_21084:158-886(+)